MKDQSPKHLFNIIPKLTKPYSTRNANNIPHFEVKYSFFKNTFYPLVIIEWNKLDPEIQNAPSFNIFKKNILKFVRLATNNIFGYHNLKGIKRLTRSRIGFSHLYEHKIKNNFQGTLNPLFTCGCSIFEWKYRFHFNNWDLIKISKCLFISIDHKNYLPFWAEIVFSVLLSFLLLFPIVLVYLFPFLRYWKYKIVLIILYKIQNTWCL